MRTTAKKIVITDFVTEPLDCERRIVGDLAEVIALDAREEGELAGRIEDADAVMMYHFLSIGAETIRRLTRCRLIVRCGVGFENVDCAAARACGIPVANVPDYGTEEVADSAIGMLLTLTRGVHYLNSRLRRHCGPWSYTQAQPVPRIRGRTLGVIGIGRIGTAVALRAKVFGLRIVFYDPYVPDGFEKSLGIHRAATLCELLRQSHVVTLHCPLTEETRHILHAGTLREMPRGGYVINTARGAVLNADDLLDAVSDGHLAGAAIDVLETEPPSPDNRLVRAWRDPAHPAHDRIIVNPHAAFYCEEGLEEMRIKGSLNCRRALLGEPLHNVVNAVDPPKGGANPLRP
jgi:D-3-phosphoglycerate dehydrogenase/C-terminal binding protein